MLVDQHRRRRSCPILTRRVPDQGAVCVTGPAGVGVEQVLRTLTQLGSTLSKLLLRVDRLLPLLSLVRVLVRHRRPRFTPRRRWTSSTQRLNPSCRSTGRCCLNNMSLAGSRRAADLAAFAVAFDGAIVLILFETLFAFAVASFVMVGDGEMRFSIFWYFF
jgi:hypothetical protein